jgi:glycosyltransferase involved in cell wall biosynthesis
MRGGGAERVALTLIQEFVRCGHEIDLVLLEADGELLDLLPPEVTVIDLGAKKIFAALRPLIRYLRERRPSTLQASLWPLTVIAILAGLLSRSRTRIVVSDHAILSAQYGGSWRTMAQLKATTRLLYLLADTRICVSEGAAEDLSRISGLSRNSFAVIHNPISQPPLPINSSPAVEQLWPGANRRILTVGALKLVKNHALLIRAFAIFARKHEASLMILGEGEERSALERLAQDLGVADRIALPGFADDPWPFYASADLFVLSSDHEGFGNVLVEAMLAGLPVVSTDCPSGPREILDGGRFGALSPVGDAGALGQAIEEGLARPIAPETLRRRAEELLAGSLETYGEIMTAGPWGKQTIRGSKAGRNSSLA